MLNSNPTPCKEMFCMEPPQFITLCIELRERQLMRSTRYLDVEESMAIFLMIIGHSQGQRVASNRSQHSTETINRHFKTVLGVVGRLTKIYIRVRHRTGMHSHVSGDPKYHPWFKASSCPSVTQQCYINATFQILYAMARFLDLLIFLFLYFYRIVLVRSMAHT